MPLNIAIVGGGVGGLAAAIALRRHPGLRVDVYERTAEFRELGALIGLAPNGLRTLEKLGVDGALADDIGWRSPSGVPMVFRHWQTADTLSQDLYHHVPDRRHHFARMHRAWLQQAMLDCLPADVLHLGKKAVSATADAAGGRVVFEDGTEVVADLVVGADGIKSKVRESFLPNHSLTSSGDAIFRTTFPYELVADLEGLYQDSTHFQSPSSWFFGTRIGSDGFGVTCSFRVDGLEFSDAVWNVPADVDDIRGVFKDFCPPIPQIVDRIPPHSLRRYANVAGAPLDRWSFGDGRVVLLGDAAHPHGGAYAAGASLAIDDAYTLYLALRAVLPEALPDTAPDADRLRRALALFEAARRPHTKRVLASVHASREAQARRLEKVRLAGLDEEPDEQFRARHRSREDPVWLTEHDAEAAFRAVLVRAQL